MRRKFSLDVSTSQLDNIMMLIHGGYASGKTHLLGDFLKYYSTLGKVRFLNVVGEDGFLSAKSFNLGNVGETVENFKDMMDALAEFRKEGILALGVDSMKYASRIAMAEALGTDTRLPEIVKGGSNEWGAVHFAMENLTNHIRATCPFVLCVSPSDRSVDQLNGKTYITPDLPGRQARESIGWFDFVGYLSAEVQGATGGGIKIVRKVMFAPNNLISTRQRLSRPILEDIVIPENGGGYVKILNKINEILKGDKK